MPIVMIHTEKQPASVSQMLGKICEAGAKALDCDPANVWATFHPLLQQNYVRAKEAERPPIVFIKANAGRSKQQRHAFVTAVAAVVSEALLVPIGSVWVHYDEM